MTDTTATLDGADLIEALHGSVARREYDAAPETTKPGLLDYARTLGTLSDDDLVDYAASAILDSAIVARFRGNFNAEECRTTMCHSESMRRQVAAGHDEWCSVGSLYGSAYNRVVRSQGHSGLADVATTCACKEKP